jgi:hypothetical protein
MARFLWLPPCPEKYMDPMDKGQLTRLWDAIEESRRGLKVFRTNRRGLLREYTGSNYSDDGAELDVPVNFLHLAFSIYRRNLISGEPRAKVDTPFMQLKRTGDLMRLALDQRGREIKLRKRIAALVDDALFGVGIANIGLKAAGRVQIGSRQVTQGESYVARVSLDDWVHDMTATDWESIQFAGHRYRIPLDQVVQSGQYQNTDKLQATDQLTLDSEEGEEKSSAISRGDTQTSDKQIRPLIDLWDLWLPDFAAVVTLPEQRPGTPIRIVRWEGPPSGPYRLLAFDPIPDQIMPLSPGAQLLDMHVTLNRLFRKLADQAERSKVVMAAAPGEKAQRDAHNVINAADGDVIGVNDPNNIREMHIGVADANTSAIFLAFKQLFDYFGGNLSMMGGLGPQSETATQDRMLMGMASKKIEDMRDATVEFVGDILQDLAYYEWTNPLLDRQVERRRRDGSTEEHRLQQRELAGKFFQYHFSVEPYSLQRRGPAERLATVMQVIQGFVMPAIALFARKGLDIDLQALIRLISMDANVPELAEVITAGGQPIDLVPGSGGQMRQSPVTTRTNIRENRPGATPRGAEDVLMRGMLGQGSQPAEMDAAVRAGV